MQRVKSNKLFNKTKKMIPGGVNSPVRSFSAVSGSPLSSRSPKALRLLTLIITATLTLLVHGEL